jgi:hypothetical protein
MEFRNYTPFPALVFEGIDQRNQPFHVMTLRQTLTWDDVGKLEYTDEQAPLNVEDRYFGESKRSVVREESDLCHFKPHCDVIVNGFAHAPKNQPARRFKVHLRLMAPLKGYSLPEPPQGLNPLQQPSEATQRDWLAACEKNRQMPPRDRVLIDKSLIVLGERWFVRRFWPLRLLATLIRWCSLGTLCPATWRLNKAKKTLSVPIRADLSFGGQCRVDVTDKAAKRTAKRHRLKPPQCAEFPGVVALEGLPSNPVGRGWVRGWYLKAKRLKRTPAPQIERHGHPVKISHFTKAQRGKLKDERSAALIAGLGIRPKGHPERASLVGSVDDEFINGKNWLPADFDFAVWNAAWPDQQTRYLVGNETIELLNLCHPNATGVRYNRDGDTVLRLTLPQHDCFALLRYDSGEMIEQSLVIDTLILEPDTQTLSLVWRAKIDKEPDYPLSVIEARLRTFEARDQAARDSQQLMSARVVSA